MNEWRRELTYERMNVIKDEIMRGLMMNNWEDEWIRR